MRSALLAILFVSAFAGAASAQVINGETPLDETRLDRPTPEPSPATREGAAQAVPATTGDATPAPAGATRHDR